MVAVLLTASLTGLAMAASEDNNVAEPYFLSVTGVVTGIEEQDVRTQVEISLPDADREAKAFLNIDSRTVFVFDDELEVGDTVTAWYLANAPMILIYPPQYTAVVVVSGAPGATSVLVDRFFPMAGQDGLYLAQGGGLAFRVGPNTEIILADGTDFSHGDFAGRRIALVYTIATRSLPAQTTAEKLIVLFEDAVTGPLPIDPGMVVGDVPVTTLPAPVPDQPAVTLPADSGVAGWPVIVNGNRISGPLPFQNADGVVMVPLRAVAEALGYNVNWDGTMQSIRLGVAIHTWIGNTEVHVGRMAPQNISTAPVLVADTTYVPLDFFRAIGVNNIYALEGQIVVNNINDKMG